MTKSILPRKFLENTGSLKNFLTIRLTSLTYRGKLYLRIQEPCKADDMWIENFLLQSAIFLLSIFSHIFIHIFVCLSSNGPSNKSPSISKMVRIGLKKGKRNHVLQTSFQVIPCFPGLRL